MCVDSTTTASHKPEWIMILCVLTRGHTSANVLYRLSKVAKQNVGTAICVERKNWKWKKKAATICLYKPKANRQRDCPTEKRKRCVWQANVAMNINSISSSYGGGSNAFIHSAGEQVRYLQTRLFPICTLPDRGTLLVLYTKSRKKNQTPDSHDKTEETRSYINCPWARRITYAIALFEHSSKRIRGPTDKTGRNNRILSAIFNVIVIASFAFMPYNILTCRCKRERNTIANSLFIHAASTVHSVWRIDEVDE